MKPSYKSASDLPLRERISLIRTGLRVLTFEEEEREDRLYWQRRSPLERLRCIEVLRELNYAPEVVNQGLQRVLTVSGISGLEFSEAYPRRVVAVVDGVPVNIISLDDLKRNKKASGRHKDLADLENLP